MFSHSLLVEFHGHICGDITPSWKCQLNFPTKLPIFLACSSLPIFQKIADPFVPGLCTVQYNIEVFNS